MNEFIAKLKAWFMTAGLRSFGYLGASVAAILIFNWVFISGIFMGVFLADNWVTILKLVETTFNKQEGELNKE